jgi:RND family efflux transporter MFP subunit
MTKARWIALIAVLGAIGAAAFIGKDHLEAIASLDKKQAAKAKPVATVQAPAVSVVRPTMRSFTETLRVNGSLVAREEVLVAPQIDGQRIAALMVDAGDTVAKGQLLARLATENLDALVAQNDAALLRAEAGIARAKGAITQAEAGLEEAAAALKRAQPLSRSGYLSDSTLDQRRAAATAARAALAIANDNLKVAESEKADAEAKRREILWRRSRTEIHAPVAGLVLARSARLGAIATAAGEAMFRIARAGEIELEGEVTSDQLHRLGADQTVRIEVAGRPDVTGKVRLISPRVDPETRLGHVRIFIGANRDLRVGTFVTGIVATAEGKGLGIPEGAIMRDAEGPYVQVVRGQTVRRQRLKTSLRSDGFIEVTDGLTAQDQVVAKAGTFLGDGARVTPVPSAEAKPKSDRTGDQPKAG